MHYFCIHPHDRAPNPQLAILTMFVPWSPRVFFRVVPGASKNEMIAQFICLSRHWSDLLFLLPNKEQKMTTLHAILTAPESMVDRNIGLQVMGTEDCETLIIRRDALDVMENRGIRDKWFDRVLDFMRVAQQCGLRTAVYDEKALEEQAVKDGRLQAEKGTSEEAGGAEEAPAEGAVEEGAVDREA